MPLPSVRLPFGRERWSIRGPVVTYHDHHEERFKVDGRYAEESQVEWILSAQLQEMLPPELTYHGPLYPDYEEAGYMGSGVLWECNDSDRTGKRVSDGYVRAGQLVGDDPSADIDVMHRVSGDPERTLRAIAEWEDRVVDEPGYKWMLSSGRAGTLQISYYVICERFVSAGKVFWGFTLPQVFGPVGTYQYDNITERLDKLREIDEDVVVSVAGAWVRLKLGDE
jgi:hypothetical protein